MEVDLQNVLIAIVEQRNDALNKLAETTAHNKMLRQQVQDLTISQEKTKEKEDLDEAQTETS